MENKMISRKRSEINVTVEPSKLPELIKNFKLPKNYMVSVTKPDLKLYLFFKKNLNVSIVIQEKADTESKKTKKMYDAVLDTEDTFVKV